MRGGTAQVLRGKDGAPSLHMRISRPDGGSRAAALITHGYAEHSGRYDHVIDRWNARGILVGSYDLRGHGDSEGVRGHVSRFEEYVDDALAVLTELEKDPDWRALSPPILFGHSLGGLISIHVALAAPDRVAALVLSSPFLGLGFPVPSIRQVAGKAISEVLPTFALPSGLKGENLTRDPAAAASYDSDPKIFKTATVRWFSEVMAAQRKAIERAPSLNLPLNCLQAESDRIVAVADTERFIERIGSVDTSYERVPGAFHAILEDIGRDTHIDRFAAAILDWHALQRDSTTEF
jgi:alpha-beta hydrolase superfamily lysophospholipase